MSAPAPALTADPAAAGPIPAPASGSDRRSQALILLRHPLVITLGAGWLIGDALHLPLEAVLALAAGVAGWSWLAGRRSPLKAVLPDHPAELLERCRGLLEQFAELAEADPGQGPSRAVIQHRTTSGQGLGGLEGGDVNIGDVGLVGAEVPWRDIQAAEAHESRRRELEQLAQRSGRRRLEVALLGTALPDQALQAPLLAGLQGSLPLRLHWGHPLPRRSDDWSWPGTFQACDALLFHLIPPLQACDLRWLQAIPEQQPAWVLVQLPEPAAADAVLAELRSQLPPGLSERLMPWNGAAPALADALGAMRGPLQRQGVQALRTTDRRLLEQLHRRWQRELELLRRERFQQIQQRTQWLVAAGVFAAPLASLDLLVLAVANGLMLQEMARLWRCPWGAAQLREAAGVLAQAALGLGLAEWSSRSLAAVLKLHGATWLVGGALQALSAAYLTRVVGAAMADVLALSVGVDAPDLEAIRRRAPELVAAAAARERLDWSGFLEQGRRWLRAQPAAAGLAP